MSIDACAELVRRGDPERFRAVMASPAEARAVLFSIYAFNLEVARAPWMTAEPMIAEMRLQWWIDVLGEIEEGKEPRRHEVVAPLAEVIDARGAQILSELVQARRWDIYSEAFEDSGDFTRYIDATAGNLAWAAMRALGVSDAAEAPARAIANAGGLARFLTAVPALEDAGRVPMVDGRPEAVARLAQDAVVAAKTEAWVRYPLGRVQSAPLIEAMVNLPLLEQTASNPGRVGQGGLGMNPARQSLRLMRFSLSRRWGKGQRSL